MTKEEFISALNKEEIAKFDLLSHLCNLIADNEEVEARELLLFALEKKKLFPVDFQQSLDSIIRSLGLYPYLTDFKLGIANSLIVEANTNEKLNLVFHRDQTEAFRSVMHGDNLILSAPTSFGKSTVIDAILASCKFERIAIVVPTIALIDELRIRFAKHSDFYKIITHHSQDDTDSALFILTPERVCEWPRDFNLNIFVIDEFYKLDSSSKDQRSITLNAAFARLYGSGTQFYLLGPNIDSIKPSLPSEQLSLLNAKFKRSDFHTVAARVTRVSFEDGHELDKLAELCSDLDSEPTIVYFKSPDSLRAAFEKFNSLRISKDTHGIENAISWCNANISSNWSFVRALKQGIGMHHGKLPRALSHWVVKAFNDGRINLLFCTSTLIEGVNTRAKNVIVFDNKIANRKFDFFTFSNIRGRTGRMSRYFVGDVYLFYEPPMAEQKEVIIPVLEQDADTSLNVLLNIDPSKLNELSRDRLDSLRDSSPLPLSLLKSNSEINPELQIAVARKLMTRPRDYNFLRWSNTPTFLQLKETLKLIFEEFKIRGNDSAKTYSQLANFLLRSQSARNIRDLATMYYSPNYPSTIEDQIENALDFRRTWMEYKVPSLLMSLHRIQEHVFNTVNIPPGNYVSFASRVSNLYYPQFYSSLEEYGIPLEVTHKLMSPRTYESLDQILNDLKKIPARNPILHPFEHELLTSALRTF